MRDLSEALPLVEQAEAALDVLDKKDRGTGGKQLGTFDWKVFAKDVQRAISRSVFRTAGQQMLQQLHIIYLIYDILYTAIFYLLPPETSTTLPGI